MRKMVFSGAAALILVVTTVAGSAAAAPQSATVNIKMRGQTVSTGLAGVPGGTLDVTVGPVPPPCLALDQFRQQVALSVGGTYLGGLDFSTTTTRTLTVGGTVTLGPITGLVGDGPDRDACIDSTTTVTVTHTPPPPAPTSTSVTSSVNPSVTGQAVTFTATVAASTPGSTPTGTVAFSDGGTRLATLALAPDGRATFASSTLSAGVHAISVVYGGDANHSSSNGTLIQTVARTATATSLVPSANPTRVGKRVTYTATVSPAPGGGTVAFTDDGAPLAGCAAVAVSGGVARCTLTPATIGAHNITAAFSGTATAAAGTSAPVTVVVTPGACAKLAGCNLKGLDLAGALLAGANLHQANLRGTDLTGADLRGVILTGADLTKADLTRANLFKAVTNKNTVLKNVTWSGTTCPDGASSDAAGSSCAGHLGAGR